MKYLTPQAYRLADEGLPGLAGLPDTTIAQKISEAETSIDTFMGFPLLNPNGFAPGNTGMTQYGFDFDNRRIRFPLPPVPVRRVTRLQVHISNASGSGAPLLATFFPADVVLNQYDTYGEIVALQGIFYSLAFQVAGLGLRPPILEADFECGFYLPVTGELLLDVGNHLTYQAQRQFWATSYTQASSNQPLTLPAIPPVVSVNGSVVSSSLYTVNATEGTITFLTAQSASASITCDYTYQIPDSVRRATIAQVTYLLGQRALNALGMQGIEVARSGDQQVKRHIRSSGGASALDEAVLCPSAMSNLMPYKSMPMG